MISGRSRLCLFIGGSGRSPFKATTEVRIPVGAQVSDKPPTDDVERFLSLVRFDSRGKVNALGCYADLEINKTDS